MSSEEVRKELDLSYQELVDYLLGKYGPAQYDYFVNETCRSKNKKVRRSDEGLICHHIDEDKAIMLSDTPYAIQNPFEYQKADRLVYCNIMEHLILHIKIAKEADLGTIGVGIGGVVNFICPEINDYYGGYEFKRPYQIKSHELIADNFEDYIKVLRYCLEMAENDMRYVLTVDRERLSRGCDGKIVEKVYKALR